MLSLEILASFCSKPGWFQSFLVANSKDTLSLDAEFLFICIFSVRGRQMQHITRITAKDSGSDKTFNSYVFSTVPFSLNAQQKTSPTTMSVHGQPVESVRIKSALEKFLKWHQKFHNIISVAHNGRRFPGFIDSLAVFRKKYPDRPNYKQDFKLTIV